MLVIFRLFPPQTCVRFPAYTSTGYLDDAGLPVPPPGEEGYAAYYAVHGGEASDYLVPQSTGFTRRLSTISERTEQTERTRGTQRSGPWPTRQEILATRRPPSTPTTSSYGQVLHPSKSTFGLAEQRSVGGDDARSVSTGSGSYGNVIGKLGALNGVRPCVNSPVVDNERLVDPNDIHPSPSLSAIRQLEIRTPSPSPSVVTSRSGSTVQAPPKIKPYQTPGPGIRGHGIKSSSSISSLSALRQRPPAGTERSLPEIPQSERSRSEVSSPQIRSKDPLPHPGVSPKKSKLASLASSRRAKPPPSETSESYATTETTATYPELRPRSLTSEYTSVPESLPKHRTYAVSRDESVKSPAQQREDARSTRSTYEPLPVAPPEQTSRAPFSLARSGSLSLRSIPSEAPGTPIPNEPRSASETATEQGQQEHPENEPVVTNQPTSVSEKPGLSKLAQLAQAKAAGREHSTRKIQRPRILNPPFAKTEYFNPTSNNPSSTTAITTYTQRVDNMVAMSRADLPPSCPPDGKQSKLAQKAKKSHANPGLSTLNDEQREALDRARNHARSLISNGTLSAAAPSPFASLLVNDRRIVKQPGAEGESAHEQRVEQKAKQKSEERLRRRLHKEALLPMHLLNPVVLRSTAFAFDVPSPDDIVMHARRGTAMDAARHGVPRSKHS